MSVHQEIKPEIEFSIIVPTYNERENIGLVVAFVNKTFEQLHRVYELIVIDDSSPDGTQEIVKRLQNFYGNEKVVCTFNTNYSKPD
eukprot:g7346.t1